MTDRVFTPEELAQYDGRDGRPVYLACFGLVYDATESWAWERGRHMARHGAGQDLTVHIAQAPHGPEFLGRLRVVGRLGGGSPGSPGNPGLGRAAEGGK